VNGQTACKIWKAAAEPVLKDYDNISIHALKGALMVLSALKVVLCHEVVRDEHGALSVISRDHSLLTGHIKWKESTVCPPARSPLESAIRTRIADGERY